MTADTLDPAVADRLRRTADGLLPVVVQDVATSAVLMLAWVDDEALRRTLTTGRGTYWSRSRRQYWVKGETSGHVQWVHQVQLDCDADTLLFRVRQVGPACHTGTTTCFDGRDLAVTVTDPALSTPLEERGDRSSAEAVSTPLEEREDRSSSGVETPARRARGTETR